MKILRYFGFMDWLLDFCVLCFSYAILLTESRNTLLSLRLYLVFFPDCSEPIMLENVFDQLIMSEIDILANATFNLLK